MVHVDHMSLIYRPDTSLIRDKLDAPTCILILNQLDIYENFSKEILLLHVSRLSSMSPLPGLEMSL